MSNPTRSIETLEILGGAHCLDFANTLNSRSDPEHDYLHSYTDLVEWSMRVGIITAVQGKRLSKLAGQNNSAPAETLKKGLDTRELIYQVFSKIAKRTEPDPKELQQLAKLYAQAVSHGALRRENDHFTMVWELAENLEGPLWPVLYSAGQLLLSSELARVKGCPNCGWLFLDRSKNQSRRWCNMDTCGVRDKMHRYQKKLRAVKA